MDPMCGAARTLTNAAVIVCERRVSEHAGLDHLDPRHGLSWPICGTYCPDARDYDDPPERHICGRYRLDTAGAVT